MNEKLKLLLSASATFYLLASPLVAMDEEDSNQEHKAKISSVAVKHKASSSDQVVLKGYAALPYTVIKAHLFPCFTVAEILPLTRRCRSYKSALSELPVGIRSIDFPVPHQTLTFGDLGRKVDLNPRARLQWMIFLGQRGEGNRAAREAVKELTLMADKTELDRDEQLKVVLHMGNGGLWEGDGRDIIPLRKTCLDILGEASTRLSQKEGNQPKSPLRNEITFNMCVIRILNGEKKPPFNLCRRGISYQSEFFDRTISNRAALYEVLSLINWDYEDSHGDEDLYKDAWLYGVRLLRDPMFPHHERTRAILMLGKMVPRNIQNYPGLVLCVKDALYDDEILKMLKELTLNLNAQVRTQAKDCIKTIELAKKDKVVKGIPSEDEYAQYFLRILEDPHSWDEQQEQAIKHLMKIAERKRATKEYIKLICERLDKVISHKENTYYDRENAQKSKDELLKKYGESVPAGA